MGKQYISTAIAGNAHKSDILDLAICSLFTATVSSDGYLKLWSNKDVSNPKETVLSYFVEPLGLHHVAIYENIIEHQLILIVAVVSFSGKIHFKQWIDGQLVDLNLNVPFKDNWCLGFWKDPETKTDYLLVNQVDSTTNVYQLTTKEKVSVEHLHSIKPTISSMAHTIAMSPVEKKCAVGYTNGDVVLYEIESGRSIYSFHSTDLSSEKNTVSSLPRAIKFSPGGTLVAVARDNGSSGALQLYDVKFGENVGSLSTSSHSSKKGASGFAHSGWIMGIDFNDDGTLLATGGTDECVRIWNVETRDREATINVSKTDLDDADLASETDTDNMDNSFVSGVSFIKKGFRTGAGDSSNDGLAVISFDRGVRWYREAGGI